MSENSSRFAGVQRSASKGVRHTRYESKPWKAQLNARGHNYYLGSYATDEEAADAYDNAAYWLGLEGYRYKGLNFPDRYKVETCPAPTETTIRVLTHYRARVHVPDNLRLKGLLRAYIAAKERSDKAWAEYLAALSGREPVPSSPVTHDPSPVTHDQSSTTLAQVEGSGVCKHCGGQEPGCCELNFEIRLDD